MTSKENLYRAKSSGHSLIFTELREQKKYTIGWTGTIRKIQGEKEKTARKSQCWRKRFGPSRKNKKEIGPWKIL